MSYKIQENLDLASDQKCKATVKLMSSASLTHSSTNIK